KKKKRERERVKGMILSLGQHTLLQNVSVMKMLRLVKMQVNDFEKYNSSDPNKSSKWGALH
ncbi:MAG: hypothetical protein LGB58_06815, partial [Sulfurovum sp.]|nr:hypothetical protein [Sulfurovum sp.]